MELLKQNRGLFIFEGVLFIILGILAIAAPVAFTFGAALALGALLIIAGLIQGYQAFALLHRPGFYFSISVAIVSLIIGILFIASPLKGVLALTMLLMAYFFISGLFKIVMSLELRPLEGWGWLLVSGILGIILGAIIYSGWPETALWVIGLLLGIDMLFFGISLISFAWALPKPPSSNLRPPSSNSRP